MRLKRSTLYHTILSAFIIKNCIFHWINFITIFIFFDELISCSLSVITLTEICVVVMKKETLLIVISSNSSIIFSRINKKSYAATNVNVWSPKISYL
jgi:hypothetical protein